MGRKTLRSLAIVTLASVFFAVVTPVPPTEQALIGSWVGFTSMSGL